MSPVTGETIWVTGASSGIGRELALQLARAGNHVIASARSSDTLAAMAQSQSGIAALPFDVTQVASLPQISQQLSTVTQSIDRVIINAGNCEYLDIDTPDWGMMQRLMEINFLGAVRTVELALFPKTWVQQLSPSLNQGR